MSTLEELFAIHGTERPLRFGSTATSPAALLREELKRLGRAHRDEVDALLVRIARVYFHLHRAVNEHAAGPDGTAALVEVAGMVAHDLTTLISGVDVVVEDLTGKPWDESARAVVDVRGHTVREGLDVPRISHMELPVIRQSGRVIGRGVALIEVPAGRSPDDGVATSK
jgi:hypothetical protein